jgi:hypothetical protein
MVALVDALVIVVVVVEVIAAVLIKMQHQQEVDNGND